MAAPSPLAGLRIVLGVSGGIAAYKAAALVRLLRKAEAEVVVVMTESATQFIGPLTLATLSGKPVVTSLWERVSDDSLPSDVEHIGLWAGHPYLIYTLRTNELAAWRIVGRTIEAIPLTS